MYIHGLAVTALVKLPMAFLAGRNNVYLNTKTALRAAYNVGNGIAGPPAENAQVVVSLPHGPLDLRRYGCGLSESVHPIPPSSLLVSLAVKSRFPALCSPQ